jgi:protein TonB
MVREVSTRGPFVVSGLGHAVVLGLCLTLAALQPNPRLVPAVRIVAVGNPRSTKGAAIRSTPPAVVPKPQPQPQPAPPVVPPKPAAKPVDKAPPQRDKPKPPDPKGVHPPEKADIVSKTPAKPVPTPVAAPKPTPAAKPADTSPVAGTTDAAGRSGSATASKGVVGIEAEGDEGPASEYLQLLRDKVAANWQPPAAVERTGDVAAVVFFTIDRSGGAPRGVTVQMPSGAGSFDRAAIRAILDAAPLQPLPQQWPYESIGIKFTFTQQY